MPKVHRLIWILQEATPLYDREVFEGMHGSSIVRYVLRAGGWRVLIGVVYVLVHISHFVHLLRLTQVFCVGESALQVLC